MWEIIHLDNSKKRDEDVSFYSQKEYIWEGAPLRGDSVGSKKNAIVMRAQCVLSERRQSDLRLMAHRMT